MKEEGLPLSVEDLVEYEAQDLVGLVEQEFVRIPGPMSTQAMQLTVVTKLTTDSGTEYELVLHPDAKIIDTQVSARNSSGKLGVVTVFLGF